MALFRRDLVYGIQFTTLLRAEHGLTAPFLRPAAARRMELNITFVMDNRRILTG